jgi:hypothetical protein
MVKPPAPRIVEAVMPHHAKRRRKPELSGHQKQIRFFTRLLVVLCSLLTLAVFWFVNHTGPIRH